MLKFDNGTHDDFVDAISWMGIGLMRVIPASREVPENDKVIRVGSMAWIKGVTRQQERMEKRMKSVRGM